jgi:hypothetical protein
MLVPRKISGSVHQLSTGRSAPKTLSKKADLFCNHDAVGNWKQQASGIRTTLPPAPEQNPSKQRLAMARHTTDAEKTLYRVGGLPHDADAASPKRSKVPLNCVL